MRIGEGQLRSAQKHHKNIIKVKYTTIKLYKKLYLLSETMLAVCDKQFLPFLYHHNVNLVCLSVCCSLLPLEQYTFQFLPSINLENKFYFNSGLIFDQLWETVQPSFKTDSLESQVCMYIVLCCQCNLAL